MEMCGARHHNPKKASSLSSTKALASVSPIPLIHGVPSSPPRTRARSRFTASTISRAAVRTSSSVVCRPQEILSVPRAYSLGTCIASSTAEARAGPWAWQAEPAETATVRASAATRRGPWRCRKETERVLGRRCAASAGPLKRRKLPSAWCDGVGGWWWVVCTYVVWCRDSRAHPHRSTEKRPPTDLPAQLRHQALAQQRRALGQVLPQRELLSVRDGGRRPKARDEEHAFGPGAEPAFLAPAAEQGLCIVY